MKPLNACIYKSPIDDIGEIRVIADGEQLCLLDFNDNNVRNQARFERLLRRRYGDFKITRQPDVLDMQSRLARYFAGDWTAFDGLKPQQLMTAGTDFQRQVWAMLQTIPVGETMSYSRLASAIGRPKAVRAAASANANNPLTLIIPCHRVIGKDGTLRGYAGDAGEKSRKKWLLQHEGFL